ncbi:MAG TPA: TIGR04086 family membrane protein [Acidimicrobiia bacterium]|nr:TIGR04086 family membrane protein [Acidimicrobiia bacterium]
MSTRGRPADIGERQMWDDGQTWVEGKRDRLELAREAGWGGVSWRSVVAGVLVAYGVIGACIGIAAAVLHPLGLSLESFSRNDWRQVGLIAGLVAAAVFLGAFTFGGYTAGRMARRAGLRNGVLVAVFGVALLAAVAAVARLEGATSAIVDRLEGVGAPTDGTTWYGLGALSGAAALGGMILGGVLGGVRGERWHQRLLVRAANPDIGPDADLRAEAERQRRAAEKALARARKAGVMEVPDGTDTPTPEVRTIPAGDGDVEEVAERTDTPMPGVRTISARNRDKEEEEPDHTRSEPAPTAAGPPMRPSS